MLEAKRQERLAQAATPDLVKEALNTLEHYHRVRKDDPPLAKQLFREAVGFAKAQGQQDAASGKAMPPAFEKEEALSQFWKDGVKEHTLSQRQSRGMSM